MWCIIFTFLIAGISAQIVSQAGDKCSRHYVCPPQYLRLSQNCYFFSKNKTTWQEAFFTCQDLHGKFAIIRNAHQDKMLRSFLNKVSLVAVERWIGGMYDWEQMMWKWGASGKEIKYNGFTQAHTDDKEKLKWYCVVLDPILQYRWNSRSCLEEKHFICQTKLRKVAQKERKKLLRQYKANKYNMLNEIPVPDILSDEKNNTYLKERKSDDLIYKHNDLRTKSAFAHRNNTVIEKRIGKRKNKKYRTNKKSCSDPYILRNETEYNTPQLKFGKRRRRNKSKEDKDASIENIQTKIYYSGVPESPLHPRIITEELSFN